MDERVKLFRFLEDYDRKIDQANRMHETLMRYYELYGPPSKEMQAELKQKELSEEDKLERLKEELPYLFE